MTTKKEKKVKEVKKISSVPIFNSKGKEIEKFELDKELFTGEVNKGALYHEYCLKVHSFLTHLRRVHPKLPPTMIDVSGQGIRIPVKAADPLAPTGRPLYSYHGKTALYNDLFFILWDSVIHRVFQYVCPWMIVKTQQNLETLLSLEFIG